MGKAKTNLMDIAKRDFSLTEYFKFMRPVQWVKNLLCFAGVIFSGKFTDFSDCTQAALVFMVFCLTASSIYMLNDLFDVADDKLHPIKKNRPLASGSISIAAASILVLILLVSSLFASWYISRVLFYIIVTYIILNFAYSVKLKQIPILDVFIISMGFILRLFAGTLAIDIPPSKWIIICTFMLSLLMGFVKRYSEMKSTINTRKVIDKYNSASLEKLISITASCSVLSYAIFVIEKNQLLLIFSIFPVCYAIFHIILDLNLKHKGEDFSKDLFNNPHILISLIVWLATYCLIRFYI